MYYYYYYQFLCSTCKHRTHSLCQGTALNKLFLVNNEIWTNNAVSQKRWTPKKWCFKSLLSDVFHVLNYNTLLSISLDTALLTKTFSKREAALVYRKSISGFLKIPCCLFRTFIPGYNHFGRTKDSLGKQNKIKKNSLKSSMV